MTVSDNLGNSGLAGAPSIIINEDGVIDPLGRSITYSATGLPVGLSIDANTGVIFGVYDSNAGGGLLETFNIIITASNGHSSISKTFVLNIRDDG